ncbi:MAG: hemerythrin domain-containing protein [Pseudomonadales bacterium]|nr:hemerythrin domain-containing protein [Pseudomonadales bacterium]
MTIYQRITADHKRHRELLDKIESTEGDSRDRRQCWEAFFYDVKAHAAAEEETLYAKLIATEDGQPDARHSVHEHQELDHIMDELDEMDMSSPGWLQRFKTLKHDYLHHIEEEEEDIFKRARQEIDSAVADKLADNFEQRKDKERELVDKKAEEALEH